MTIALPSDDTALPAHPIMSPVSRKQDYTDLSTEEKRHCAGKKGATHLWQSHEAHAPPPDPELEAIARGDFGMVRERLCLGAISAWCVGGSA